MTLIQCQEQVFGLANGNNIYNSNSGNVGIGTSSPYGRLNVIPSSNPTTPTAANQISIGESSANSQYNLRLGYFLEGGAYKGSIQAISGNTPNILILNGDGGNVGIGTTSPVQKLQVNGSVYSNGGEFFVNTNSGITAVGNLIFKGHNGTSYFEGMRLASTGNVGIGTTLPTANLHVQGSSATDAPIVRVGGFGNSGSTLELAETLTSGNMTYGFSFEQTGNGTNELLIKRHNNSVGGASVITLSRINNNVSMSGGLSLALKATSSSTLSTDGGTTLTTKNYVDALTPGAGVFFTASWWDNE